MPVEWCHVLPNHPDTPHTAISRQTDRQTDREAEVPPAASRSRGRAWRFFEWSTPRPPILLPPRTSLGRRKCVYRQVERLRRRAGAGSRCRAAGGVAGAPRPARGARAPRPSRRRAGAAPVQQRGDVAHMTRSVPIRIHDEPPLAWRRAGAAPREDGVSGAGDFATRIRSGRLRDFATRIRSGRLRRDRVTATRQRRRAAQRHQRDNRAEHRARVDGDRGAEQQLHERRRRERADERCADGGEREAAVTWSGRGTHS